MKTTRYLSLFPTRAAALGSAALLALSAVLSQAQTTDLVVTKFDTEEEVASWSLWWGNTPWTGEFDATVDADNDANSGAFKNTLAWAAGVGDQSMIWRTLNGSAWNDSTMVSGLDYDRLSFDIKWDPSSGKNAAGNYGKFAFGVELKGWAVHVPVWSTNAFPTGDGWMHLEGKIDPATANIDKIVGVWMQSVWQPGEITSPQTFWVDNIVLHANTNTVIPAPTLAFKPSKDRGLHLIASAPGDYPRQSIKTVANTYSWVGQGNQPVTYAIDLTSFPDAANDHFQAHMFLVPSDTLTASQHAPDWSEPNDIFIQIQNLPAGDTNGVGMAYFTYKTNAPNSNTMNFNTDPAAGPVGHLATLYSTKMLGTWSVTFLNDTSVTMTAPDGSSTNFTLPSASAALFANPLFAYFGNQPNGARKTGQSSTFSRVQISGVPSPIDDSFPGPGLNKDPENPVWELAADDANGVMVVTDNDLFWLTWSLPDVGFGVQASPNLKTGSWVDAGLTNAITLGKQKAVLVTTTNLPSSTSGYFRMVKPEPAAP